MKLQHTSKDKIWIDEAGDQIPYNRTTAIERKKEKHAFSLLKKGKAVYQVLADLKAAIRDASDEVLNAEREASNVKLSEKGNYTWYNFDKSIKIQVDVSEPIRFDEIKIAAAKEKLMELIRTNISGDEFIISIAEDAFQTSSGKLDPKKILGLRKHSARIRNEKIKNEWDDTMKLIDSSITRPKSKSYYKIWVKDSEGKYQGVELNFSNI